MSGMYLFDQVEVLLCSKVARIGATASYTPTDGTVAYRKT